jgi:hypothetical protein
MAGELYIAESSGKDVVGVALWFGPGREMFDRYHTFIPKDCSWTISNVLSVMTRTKLH